MPILPLHIVNIGASNLELGLVMAIPSLLSLVLRIPFGIIADIVGHLRIMLLSLFLGCLYLVLYSIAPSVLWLYLGAAMFAIPWSSFGPSAMVMASDLSMGIKIGEAVGRYLTAIGAAMMVGPLLCSHP